jgi:4-amino-4-deoxy-L-arabinose transferase-like glycosyltransferase
MNGQGLRLWPFLALALVAGVAILYFSRLGAMPLSDRDEGEYASAVSAMARSGDYVIPRLNGQPYLEKPILIYWTMAAGQAMGLAGETAARAPSALSAFGLTLLMAWLAMRVSGSLSLAVLCGAATAFMPLMALVGRSCLTDMLLTLFTTGALAFFFVASESQPLWDRRWYLAAWACLGLGFLTKGPVAVAAVLPTVLAYALWQRQLWRVLKRCQMSCGLLIFLGINLPWYGLAFHRQGEEFWLAFFLSQNLRRFSEVLLDHGGGWFYYLPVLLLGGHPFSAAALPALGTALFCNCRAVLLADPLARLRLLAALAVLVVLLAFTLAATKQINYILPAMPFLALLAGYALWRWGAGESRGRLAGSVFWGALALLSLFFILAFLATPLSLSCFWEKILASIHPDSSEYALPLEPPRIWLWPLAVASGAALTWLAPWGLLRLGQRRLFGPGLGLVGLLFSAALVLGLLPQVAELVQEPAHRLALETKARLPQEARVVSYGLWKPSLLYYLDRDVLPRIRVNQRAELEAILASGGPVAVLTRAGLVGDLAQLPGFRVLAADGGYLLGGDENAARIWATSLSEKIPVSTEAPASRGGS